MLSATLKVRCASTLPQRTIHGPNHRPIPALRLTPLGPIRPIQHLRQRRRGLQAQPWTSRTQSGSRDIRPHSDRKISYVLVSRGLRGQLDTMPGEMFQGLGSRLGVRCSHSHDVAVCACPFPIRSLRHGLQIGKCVLKSQSDARKTALAGLHLLGICCYGLAARVE